MVGGMDIHGTIDVPPVRGDCLLKRAVRCDNSVQFPLSSFFIK